MRALDRARAALRSQRRRYRKAIEWLRTHMWVLIMFGMAGVVISSEAGRFRAERDAADYRRLWNKERYAHRQSLDGRLAELEAYVASMSPQEVPREYKDRLADVRERVDRVVRGPAPASACPAPTKSPAAPVAAARADAAPQPVVKACPTEDAERLSALQEWAREHMRAYHGVEL